MTTCTVFLGLSLDGYIADRDGGLEWLEGGSRSDEPEIPSGYERLIAGTDAIVMGRTTFETVLGFGGDWPYPVPVFVLSTRLQAVPQELDSKAEVLSGDPHEIVQGLSARGLHRLYVDGGRVARDFLAAGLVDRLVLTRLPVILGGGTPLFGPLDTPLWFDPVETKTLSRGMVQTAYARRLEAAA